MKRHLTVIITILHEARAKFESVNELLGQQLLTEEEAEARRSLITERMDLNLGLRRPV